MVLDAQAPIATSPLVERDLPLPEPAPGEIRVRIRACATCRTDLHVIEGDLAPRKLPVIPGHQAVGVVNALGADVLGWRRGERVGIAWLRSTCGTCRFCAVGRENLCAASTYTGWTHDGGYVEYACVPAEFAYRIPARFDDAEAAPLLCAGIIGYRALRQSRVPPGGRLALYGFGSSAHVTLQVARHRGSTVYVCTRQASHQRLARELGAEWAGGPDQTLPVPVESAIIFAPAGDLVPLALRALDRGGTLALAGIHMSRVPALEYEPHLFWEKTVVSVAANTRQDGADLLLEAASIPLRPRVQRFALADANRALQAVKADQVDGTAVLVADQTAGD